MSLVWKNGNTGDFSRTSGLTHLRVQIYWFFGMINLTLLGEGLKRQASPIGAGGGRGGGVSRADWPGSAALPKYKV